MTTISSAPDTKALLAAAKHLDRAWDIWMEADGEDPLAGEHFETVVEAVGSLRQALVGLRRMKLSKDRYDYWRARCCCGWCGGPWNGGKLPPVPGKTYSQPISGRQQAINEFARHVCDGWADA